MGWAAHTKGLPTDLRFTKQQTMIVSILLAGLTLVGFSLGEDPTSSASTDVTTTVSPSYDLVNPAGSPTYGLNDTVQFTWEAKGYITAFYVCHSSISTDFAAHTKHWIASSSYLLGGMGKFSPIINPQKSPCILTILNSRRIPWRWWNIHWRSVTGANFEPELLYGLASYMFLRNAR